MTQVDYVNHMIRYKNVLISFYFKISNMTLVHRYAVPITIADLCRKEFIQELTHTCIHYHYI